MATIRKRNGRWQVQVRRQDQPSRSRTFSTVADARRWANEQERLADLGQFAAPDSPGGLSVRDILTRYINSVCPTKRSAGPYEALVLEAFCRRAPEVADLPVTRVAARDFSAYRDRRLQTVSNDTVLRELNIIQHAFDLASGEWGIEVENPIRPLRKPKPNAARERRLRAGEWDRIESALSECRNPLVLPVARMALATAMRRSEILSLTWAQVDLVRSTIQLLRTKNGHPRRVPLTQLALDTLASRPAGGASHQIFPITDVALKQAWARALHRAGIEDLHFHDLRHEAISRFFEMGLSLPEVALISGHRDPRQLMRYTHLEAAKIALKLREAAM
ncbi:site-specific integrase [Faunimonas sp. B44]|uniref:site-specific integrase n=1 Tax=Faunimonas sp. B44 TaxID=3461493 RepID=UPI004043ADC6